MKDVLPPEVKKKKKAGFSRKLARIALAPVACTPAILGTIATGAINTLPVVSIAIESNEVSKHIEERQYYDYPSKSDTSDFYFAMGGAIHTGFIGWYQGD